MAKELSKELQGVLKNNPIPMLRKIGLLDPQAMQTQVCQRSSVENSFYISMIKAYPKYEIRSEILQFCLDYKYNPKEDFILSESINKYNGLNVNKGSKGNDYILAWEILDDTNLKELTQYCGKDFIQETEKNHTLLESSYLKKFYQTIRLLDNFGVNDENHSGKKNILALAELDKKSLEIYWELKKDKNPELDSFGSVKNYLHRLIQNNNSKSGYNAKSQTENIKEYLSSELLKQTPENQEDLISMTVMCCSVQPLNHALKLIKTNINDYKPKNVPIWLKLSDTQAQEFLYSFIKTKVPLESYDKNTGNYYLEVMSEYLDSISYVDGDSNRHSGSSRAKKEKISNELKSIKNYDFLIQENLNAPNKETWFSTLSKEKSFMKVFGKTWMNVTLDRLTDENKPSLKEFLNKTWFYKDNEEKYSFEYAIKNNPQLLNEGFGTNLSSYLKEDTANTLISFDAKIKLFKTFVNYSWSIDSLKGFTEMFDAIAVNPEMKWKDFNIEEELEQKLLRNAPEILVKIKHYKLEESLTENDKVKKARVKI